MNRLTYRCNKHKICDRPKCQHYNRHSKKPDCEELCDYYPGAECVLTKQLRTESYNQSPKY